MKTPEEISKSDALWRRDDVEKAFGANLLPGAKKFAQNLKPLGSTLRGAGAQVGGAARQAGARVGAAARPLGSSAVSGAQAGARRVGNFASQNRTGLAVGGGVGAGAGAFGANRSNKPKKPKF